MQAASMAPTLQKNDVVLVAKGAYRRTDPRDGDIVVFDPPVTSTNPFVKRIIGLPGESLRIHNGIVYRNGVVLREPYVAQKTGYELEVANYGIYVDGERLDATEANIPPKAKWTSPNTIPPGCYILLGDNRNDSEDSHLWGFGESEDTYYTGEEAGKSAGFFEKVISIISPAEHARSLTR